MSILTRDNAYYYSKYARNTTLLNEYAANMLIYLKKMFPQLSEKDLEDRIKKIMKDQYKATPVKYLSVPSPGDVQIKNGTLLDVTNEMNRDIVSPYGATYVPISVRKSLFIPYIKEAQADRKKVKKEMLIAEAKNDLATVMLKHLRQLNIKININVLSGVMLSNVAFRSAINYNAITATARFNTMLAYSVVEMVMENNYYFYNENKAINWIVNALRVYPGDDKVKACIERYNIAIPTSEKVTEAYCRHVNKYAKFSRNTTLKEMISKLSELELAFVYYAMNLANLFRENDSFRTYFLDMFKVDQVENTNEPDPKVNSLKDGIVLTTVAIMLADEIGNNLLNEIDATNPELGRRIVSVYHHVESKLDELSQLFDVFIMLPIVPSEITLHKNMMRKMTLLSDTDSIMFTNVHWIKWATGSIRITQESACMNAAIVAIAFKMLEHVFAYVSASMNIAEENIKTIALKNEFMYDLFMRTSISKHYAGYVKFREGVRLNPHKFDLKGKNFRGSDLSKTTTGYVKKFIKDIFDNFLETYQLKPDVLIGKVIDFEQRIKKSIANGDVTFLLQTPIKLAREYKNPESSNYIYYEMWMDVFSKFYPEIHLPQKCRDLPIRSISIKNIKAVDHIRTLNPEMYERFITFLKKYPKRSFEKVLLPMDIDIPSELRDIADYRKVCATNCYSLYLILKSFNIVNYPAAGASSVLFSDIYPNLIQEDVVNV